MTTEIFNAAVRVAKRVGYRNVTLQLLADEAGISRNWLVNNFRLRAALTEMSEKAAELGVGPGERKLDSTGLWKAQDREFIIETARTVARDEGLTAVTRPKIAALAGFSTATITNYFGDIGGLVDEVMRKAVAEGDAVVVMHGLAAGSAIARAAPDKLKRAAAKALDEPVKAE